MKTMNYNTQNELVNFAIEHIKDCQPSCYGCDLHHEIFNSDYYIIGRWKAEQWLNENGGIFHNIDLIKEYEESNFGEVNTNLSELEQIVNMVVYIFGEDALSVSNTLQKKWDSKLDKEDLESIINELENSI